MSDQSPTPADIPVSRDDLAIAQDEIQMAQEALHDTVEGMKQALDNGTAIEPKLFQEAEVLAKELEGLVGDLRSDLKRLKKQQSPN